MSKKITIILLAVTTLMVLTSIIAPSVLAIDITNKLQNVGNNAGYPKDNANSLPQIIGLVIKGLLSLLGIIFMCYIIYGGYLWMTASGKEESITKAKAIIKGSIIGIIVVLGAYAITEFVVGAVISGTGYSKTG
ncbi:MAG: hypothetical protein WC675_04280 [Patescibacteria group bacterium]|jgi:hypothetical protein